MQRVNPPINPSCWYIRNLAKLDTLPGPLAVVAPTSPPVEGSKQVPSSKVGGSWWVLYNKATSALLADKGGAKREREGGRGGVGV
jgi:hypothetical protein